MSECDLYATDTICVCMCVCVCVIGHDLLPNHHMVCTMQRDGCPKIVNLGSAKTDLFYEKKKYNLR